MLVPELMLLFVANVCHVPELLLVHVAVMVWLSWSLHITYSLVGMHVPVAPLVGDGPVCVGA